VHRRDRLSDSGALEFFGKAIESSKTNERNGSTLALSSMEIIIVYNVSIAKLAKLSRGILFTCLMTGWLPNSRGISRTTIFNLWPARGTRPRAGQLQSRFTVADSWRRPEGRSRRRVVGGLGSSGGGSWSLAVVLQPRAGAPAGRAGAGRAAAGQQGR
jgi:hypothetical protein